MCGIFGIISCDQYANIAQHLIDGLYKLEYRGYDSAGIAVMMHNKLKTSKAVGTISQLQTAYNTNPIIGHVGIAHTRWATHGVASLNNAHPVVVGDIALVHNGIIENYLQLKQECYEKYGYVTRTQTDTEIIAVLIHHYMSDNSDLITAIDITIRKLHGNMSFALISQNHPGVLAVVNLGKQIVIGMDDVISKSYYVTSDPIAFPSTVHDIIYLNDGDIALISPISYEIFNISGQQVVRDMEKHVHSNLNLTMQGHATYMHKEIYEQKHVIQTILQDFLCDLNSSALEHQSVIMKAFASIDYNRFNRVHIIACGAAFYAGYVGKYLLEKYSRIITAIDIASEFYQRAPVIDNNTVYIFISQSGETADTIAALQLVLKTGAYTIGVVNRVETPIARYCDMIIPTCAGIEQSVAATKTFTAQVMIMILFAQYITSRGTDNLYLIRMLKEFLQHIDALEITQSLEVQIANIVKKHLLDASRIIYTARDILYPICLEGALKIKEIGYIAADAIPSGEIKHGPLALVDAETPVIILAPYDNTELFEKTLSNIQEIHARNGKIILITCVKGRAILQDFVGDNIITMPTVPSMMIPICYSIALQLLAYRYTLAKQYNVDKPRNLAKSVTVE